MHARPNWNVAGLLLLLVVAGCSGSASTTPTAYVPTTESRNAGGKKLTLAVIPKSTGGEFWETVEQGARDAGRDWGVTIKWDGVLTETELAEQNKIIENMVNLGVDGMALAPLNNRAMRKPVEDAVAAGIPVVIFDSAIDGDAQTSYVATNNTEGGAIAARHLIHALGPDRKRLFVLRYIQGTASTEQRTQGFLDTAQAAGFDVLADPYSEDATVAGAIKTSTNSLELFVENGRLQLDGIFATNLFSTQGMLTALEDLRRSGIEVDAVFVGFDTNEKLIAALESGTIDALVSQKPYRIGYLAVETLVKHLRGEQVPPVIDTGVELVTRERLAEPEIRKLVGLEK